MRGGLARVLCGTAAAMLLLCATAYAIRAQVGNTWVSATASLEPRELPPRRDAPVSLKTVTRIGTTDGSTPPVLQKLVFEVDKNGSVDARGIPVCTMAKLADTTPSEARKRCARSLVGTGTGKAVVDLPGSPPMRISSPLSFFNGPKIGGQPSLIAHAYETVPSPKTLLVPIAIERVHGGRYGYRAEVELPPIAEGYGAPTLAEATVGATRKRGGRTVGYLNAHCSGGRLQVQGTLSFSNGDHFPTTLTSPCHSRR
ncbi:MAG TPA: hypothetical protein VF731_06140 [Solirubrobacterales bacterium]